MALNPHYTVAIRNAYLTALCANANSGFLRIYNGTQPANADVAVSTQTLLAELTMSATAFTVAAGVATANAVTQDASANGTDTATWFRQFASNGTTVCWDGSVGTSGADCNLDTTSIVTGVPVSVTAYTISTAA